MKILPLNYDEIPNSQGLLPNPEGPFYDPPVFGDLNGDGLDDLILTGSTFPPGPVGGFISRIFLNDGADSFIEATVSGPAFRSTFSGTQIADLNSDGALDLLVADFGFDGPPFPGARNKLILGDGTGGFTNESGRLPDFPTQTAQLALGDIDGDGDLDVFENDIAVGREFERPTFLINDGNANFTRNQDLVPEILRENNLIGGEAQPRDIVSFSLLHDLDHDGAAELIVGAENAGFSDQIQSLSIFHNNGAGNFSSDRRYDAPVSEFGTDGGYRDIAVIDLNGDIYDDLVVATQIGSDFSGYALQLLLADGNGAFKDETEERFTVPSSDLVASAENLEIVDLDFDGDLDIVTLFYGPTPLEQQPFAWLNNGEGVFTERLMVTDVVPFGSVTGIFRGENENGYSLFTSFTDLEANETPFLTFTQAADPVRQLVDVFALVPPTEGNDVVRGTDEPDILALLGGNDQATGAASNDNIDGGSGNDLVLGGRGADTLNGGDGKDSLFGGVSNDSLDGGKGTDQIFGGSGNDRLSGGGGRDEINGGSGRDLLQGNGGRDLLRGAGGRDVLEGGGGRDLLQGGGNRDLLDGQGGKDTLIGGNGRDDILGGRGSDILTGNGGADRFIFDRGNGRDTISDFQQGRDKIVVQGGAADFDVLAITQFGDDVRIQIANTRVTIEDDDVANFTESDFIF